MQLYNGQNLAFYKRANSYYYSCKSDLFFWARMLGERLNHKNNRRLTMRKKWSFLLIGMIIIGVFMYSVILRDKMFQDEVALDLTLMSNISSDINVLFLTIEDLNRNLVSEDQYKKMSLEEMQIMLHKDSSYVYYTNKNLKRLRFLNKNFRINMDGLDDFVRYLHKNVLNGDRPKASDIEIVEKIYQLRKIYSNTKIFGYGLDEKHRKSYTKMELPEKTKLFFDELNTLTQTYLESQ